MSANTLIELKNIDYQIGERHILHDISLPIKQDKLLTIVGPNGAGKSTLIRLMLGHLQPTNGYIHRQPKLQMAYIPQNFHTPVDLPVTMRRFLKGLKYKQTNSPINRLNIAHLIDSPLQNLSGGETQRLMLSRALLKQPEIIFLDEPATGIDPAAVGDYYQSIRDYQLQTHCTIVMISHDIHLVMAASDKVLCLNKHICCIGKPEEISKHPEFISLIGHSDPKNIGIYTHQHTHIHL